MPRWLPWALLAAMLLVSAAYVFWVGRGTVFRGDDWELLLGRGGFNADVFLVPHNEHLSALLVAVFKLVPAIAGPHYGALRLTLLTLDLAVAVLFFVFARERAGDWIALIATAPLMLMGGGSDNLLWPTQIGVVGSLACGIGMLILLDRAGTAAKAGACLALTASIWFSSDGLFFLTAAGIWLLLSRPRWRDLWIVVIPALTYVAWYLNYGSSEASVANLRATPEFFFNSAAGGVSALTGIRPQTADAQALGVIGALIGIAALIAFFIRIKPKITPRLVAIVALPPASWLLIAVGRASSGDPFASRYVYASAIFILMAILEIARGDHLQRFFRGWKMAALVAVVGVSVLLSAATLGEKGNTWRSVSQYIHGRTAAIELTRRTIDPNLVIEPLQDMAHMTAGWYLNTVERFGESPTGAPDIASLNEEGRATADQVLAAGAPAQLVTLPRSAGPTGPPPRLDPGFSHPPATGSCLVAPARTPISVLVPASGIAIQPSGGGAASIRLRRFGATYAQAAQLSTTESSLLAIAADHSQVPWHARISSPSRVYICGASAPRILRRGPLRPPSGDQGCSPMSLGESECRFRRY